jgi:hypothetical protein
LLPSSNIVLSHTPPPPLPSASCLADHFGLFKKKHEHKTMMLILMYLRAILYTFQIYVDFYYIPVGGRGGLEGEGAREKGIDVWVQ